MPAPTHDEEKCLLQLRWPCTRALCAALWVFGTAAGPGLAQNILPNWDEGRDRPNRWQLVGTGGTRVPKTRKSGSALIVHGNGRFLYPPRRVVGPTSDPCLVAEVKTQQFADWTRFTGGTVAES